MQYADMNALQSTYADNFAILAFPCNQYWIQEPGASADEILNGIKYVRPGGGFTPNFQMFKKIQVAGENQHPLFSYLVKNCPPTRNYFASPERLVYKPIMQQDIRWNWEKFLVGKDGRVLKRYDGSTKPKEIEPDVRQVLGLAPLPPPVSEPISEPEPLEITPKKGKGWKTIQKERTLKKYYPAYKGKLSHGKPGVKSQ